MHDAFRVRGIERIGYFDGQLQQPLSLQRAAGNHVLQRDPIQVFHGDEPEAVVVRDLVDGADVGMVQGGGGPGFAAEAFQRLRIVRHFIGQELEGDEAAEHRVLGLVHHAHAAATQLLLDTVMGDDLADHREELTVARHLRRCA